MADFFNEIGDFFNDAIQTILDFLWELLFTLIELLFGWINVPSFPEDLQNSIDSFLNLIFNNLDFLGFFIRPLTLQIVIPLLLFLFNFKYIYKLSIWIIRKIPFLSMK